MRIKLIANPTSGGNALPQINQAMTFLTRSGAEVDLLLTTKRGDARAAAVAALDQDYDRIVVAGGDGTLNEVVNGVTPAEIPVGFIPLGTVNVFALEAGIPFAVEDACHLAVTGQAQRICLGRINGEAFLLMASAGWDAEAVARLRPWVKKVFGRAAYGVSAIEALLRRSPPSLELLLPDGQRLKGYGVVISNCRFYGGRYQVTPKASMFSDTLELCLLQRRGRWAILRFAVGMGLGRTQCSPANSFYTISRTKVTGKDVYVQVDGDAWGQLPIEVEALPRALSMILPEQTNRD